MQMSRAVYSLISQKDDFHGLYQDFKYAWKIFALKRIATQVYSNNSVVTRDAKQNRENFLQLMGYELAGKNVVPTKWRNSLPPMSSGKVRLSFNLDFFKAEFEGEIKPEEKVAQVSLGDFTRRSLERLETLQFTGKKLFVFFDELEVFRIDEENYTRDIRMVRDLLFAIADLNRFFLSKRIPIRLVGAVRSEVLEDVRHIGEEIGRTVRDLGLLLEWHSGPRNHEHPLMQIVQRKLRQSEIALYGESARDTELWGRYFDPNINGKTVERFLLDASFMRPRDIVRRLTVCARLAPNEYKFSSSLLASSVPDYSREMWVEIAEELVPRYSTSEVKALEQLFYGYFTTFAFESFRLRLENRCRQDHNARQLRDRIGVVELLTDLFRLGAIGNAINRDGRRVFIWYYTGRQTFDPYGLIVVHSSLWSHLSLSQRSKTQTSRAEPSTANPSANAKRANPRNASSRRRDDKG